MHFAFEPEKVVRVKKEKNYKIDRFKKFNT